MDRSVFSKAVEAAGDRGHRTRSVLDGPRSVQSELMGDPGDLVKRALGILAEDHMKGNETRPIDLQLQRPVLSDGTECPLPIRYFDVQCLVATFLTDLDRAAELLKGTGLLAVPQEDGKGVVVLYCIEYRITDIGPYNEVGLSVLAAAPGDPIPANYVVNLPVTTVVANRAGREIWGYNKFVAAIDVKSEGRKFSTILRDTENVLVGTLEGTRGASVPTPPTDILTFTLLGGKLIKTVVQVLTPFHASSGESFVFNVGTSRHPMTSNLRIVGLDGARPVLVHYADPLQALLFPGRAL
jgi:Acetoacetate decarboxylase (ADC)